MAQNAIYKRHNGENWVEYHFKTNAAQVIQTEGTGWRKFMSAKVKVNGQAFTEVTTGTDAGGATVTLTGAHIKNGVSSNGNYITAGADLNATLVALDTAAHNAALATPESYIKSAVLSNSNNTLTLTKQDNTTVSITNTTYESKTAASGGTAVSLVTTGEKYTWNNMVPNTRTINNQALSSNLSFHAANLYLSASSDTTIASELTAIRNTAEGKTNQYVAADIEDATSAQQEKTINSLFYDNRNNSQFSCAYASSADSRYVLLSTQENGSRVKLDLLSADVKVGDIFYITESNIADWWLGEKYQSSAGGVSTWHFTFYRIDVDSPTWAAIDGKPTLSVSGQTVQIGNNSVTVPALATSGGNNGSATTAARSDHKHAISAFSAAPSAVLTQDCFLAANTQYKITIAGTDVYFKTPASTADTQNTAGATDTSSKIYLVGAKTQSSNPQTYTQDTAYVDTDGCLYSGSKKVSTISVQAGTSFSGTPVSGDIWFDTTA